MVLVRVSLVSKTRNLGFVGIAVVAINVVFLVALMLSMSGWFEIPEVIQTAVTMFTIGFIVGNRNCRNVIAGKARRVRADQTIEFS